MTSNRATVKQPRLFDQAGEEHICWHDLRDGCRRFHDGAVLLAYGRCRSGKRWFWAARDWDGASRHGWADGEAAALAAARDAVVDLAAGRPALASRMERVATSTLKGLNEAKRRARAASEETSAGAGCGDDRLPLRRGPGHPQPDGDHVVVRH